MANRCVSKLRSGNPWVQISVISKGVNMPERNTTPTHPLPTITQQTLATLLQTQKQWELQLLATNLTQRQIWLLGKMCLCRHQLWATLNIEEANAIH